MKGIINLYKPKGITSSDAVVACRKILGTKAIGHMGTLDPAGEGVLLLGVGKATRLFDYFLGKDKVYEAEFKFGYTTDTLDGDGCVTQETHIVPTESEIKNVLGRFVGKIKQVPPKYSAKSVNGVRAYKLARSGADCDLPACDVQIHSLELIRSTQKNTYLFKIHCSSGTYIRSLCRDLATVLGSLATMISIKRIRCGHFKVKDSITLNDLSSLKESALISVESAIVELPRVVLPDECYTFLCNGIKQRTDGKHNGVFALYCKNELFGIGYETNGYIKIKTYLRD